MSGTFHDLFTYDDTIWDKRSTEYGNCVFLKDFDKYKAGDKVDFVSLDRKDGSIHTCIEDMETGELDEGFYNPYYGKLFCLKVVKAHPDYKRPYTSTGVYHFSNFEKADGKRKEEKRNYYEMYVDEDLPENIDDLDEDKMFDQIYCDSYMDMCCFEATITEII